MNYSERLKELLVTTAKQNASDLHIAVGRRPTLRIDGVLIQITKEAVLTPEDAEGLIMALLVDDAQKKRLETDRQVDFAYSLDEKARFRVNIYYQRGFLAASLRLIT
ncbi:MAG: type IV pili twitching motility protein PilT, partial [Candidatus Liptonbacteria bacterium]|nr:type IV pili twitching motility protein PilT [Candidatus Liptonbacteria bacterium]